MLGVEAKYPREPAEGVDGCARKVRKSINVWAHFGATSEAVWQLIGIVMFYVAETWHNPCYFVNGANIGARSPE